MADLSTFITCDKNLDTLCFETTDSNINMFVPWYLMAAHSYYVQDDPILSDQMFDKMAKKMLDNWSTIEHFNKQYITEDDLKAGTFLGEYPPRVKDAVRQLRKIYNIPLNGG